MITVRYGRGFEPEPSTREQVERLQARMLAQPQYEPPTEHHFHAGMYCRPMRMEAGSTIVGKVHKRDHFLVITSGKASINGVLFEGLAVIPSTAGAKRAIHALTDVTMLTVHQCRATTVEDAERELVEDDPTSPFTTGNRLRGEQVEVLT